ncbi:Y-family DNA polymerase [Pseudoteredinibacter isoporae]|uniref:Protein ImuB n=1 Tax=Pseudoteredinibacter isoporae TaxID=570281 RepID=A0A7X0JS97_9GAMM|nr:DNA polymerase Y family protein [Pseudoteredinibacter isoporae]MBB6521367.1 protein ImuB [Pseudoteredinibacter isoporae]NHO86922.1 DNA polymerase Y family protein [Pseudoteredinibacter isoporae]NIB24625.1 DNA polymerase Y family protein [Pseudoteredinibacter isoporae]
MRWLYLHFYQLQLDHLYQEEASDTSVDHQRRATIIVDGQGNEVCQACPSARQQGIRLGMGLAAAIAMQSKLQVLDYRPLLEQELLQHVAELLYPVSASLVLQTPQGLLLEIQSMLRYHRGLDNYWQQIQQQLKPLNYFYANAHSPWAAQLLACNGYQQLFQDTPEGQQKLKQSLAQIPCSRLPLKKSNLDRLESLGIHHVDRLLKLPLQEISRRFDEELLLYLGRLNNELSTPLAYYQPREIFERQLQLFYEIYDSDTLIKPISPLLEQLQQFLQQRDLQARQVDIHLQLRDSENITLTLRASRGEEKAKRWQALLQLRLERLQLPAPVEAIRIFCEQHQRRGQEHAELFSPHQGQLSREQLLDSLQARLGKQRIQFLQTANSHIPEHSNHLSSQEDKDQLTLPPPDGLRPSFLLPVPQQLKDEVLLFYGPERIQNPGWEDDKAVERDYFIARDQQGRWLWLFKTPAKHWFVHGYFA